MKLSTLGTSLVLGTKLLTGCAATQKPVESPKPAEPEMSRALCGPKDALRTDLATSLVSGVTRELRGDMCMALAEDFLEGRTNAHGMPVTGDTPMDEIAEHTMRAGLLMDASQLHGWPCGVQAVTAAVCDSTAKQCTACVVLGK